MNTTTTRQLLRCALLAALSSMALDASASCNFAGADAALDNLIAADGITGGALIVGSAEGILHEYYTGTYTLNGNTYAYDANAKIPVASATKLLSGVRMLQLRDRGFVDFDAPVSQYLPMPAFGWNVANGTDRITVRQMFSHTAGFGNDEGDAVLNPALDAMPLTLKQSVQDIADDYEGLSPQNYLPAGTQFAYGGVAMQIGGEVAQVQTAGQPSPYGGNESGAWQADWQHDVGAPLCATSIDWQGLGPTLNFRISGGAQSTLEDYARVLAMLLDDGVGNGTRILSHDAVAMWTTSQTGSATPGCALGCVPSAEIFTMPGGGTYANTQYSVGAWIEPDAAHGGVSLPGAPVVSSIGKFGFAPWVDFASGTYGILMVYDTANSGETGQDAASVTSHSAMQRIIADAVFGVRAQVPPGGICPAMTVYDHLFAANQDAAPVISCPGTVPRP